MEKVFIIAAARTPIGKFGGALRNLHPSRLGAAVCRGVLERAGVKPEQIDEVIFGHARQAGCGPNLARQVAVRTGLPFEIPAFTVNKACASGMKAVALAFQSVQLGENRLVLAGGAENMSRIPYLLEGARWGYRLGHQELTDAMYRDGLFCPLTEKIMGETAETLAENYQISRLEQDTFACQSQQKAALAQKAGYFKPELIPLTGVDPQGKDFLLEIDEHPRPDSSLEKLAKLSPVFKKDGTITAGNSSGLTDGAAALLLASESACRELGFKPMAEIIAVASAGVDPALMGLGPVPAVKKLLKKTGLSLNDFGVIELNEAFAAQVLAVIKELGISPQVLNPQGGAIALGHPIGASGARILVTMLYAMKALQTKLGLATLCVSGGLGMAVALKSL